MGGPWRWFWSPSETSSGRYGAHAYESRLRAGVETTYTLSATGGAWSPALLVIEDLGHLKTPPSKSLERLRAWLRRNGKTAWVGLYADPSNRRTRAPEWGGLYQATYRAELVALPKQVRLEL